MSHPAETNPQVVNMLHVTFDANYPPEKDQRPGSAKAYQAVAQAMAVAVQDSVDQLRNMSALANTASGMALAQMLSTRDPAYATAIVAAQGMVGAAAERMKTLGVNAGELLQSFPTGPS